MGLFLPQRHHSGHFWKLVDTSEASRRAFLRIFESSEGSRGAFLRIVESSEASREAFLRIVETSEVWGGAFWELVDSSEASRGGFRELGEGSEASRRAFGRLADNSGAIRGQNSSSGLRYGIKVSCLRSYSEHRICGRNLSSEIECKVWRLSWRSFGVLALVLSGDPLAGWSSQRAGALELHDSLLPLSTPHIDSLQNPQRSQSVWENLI